MLIRSIATCSLLVLVCTTGLLAQDGQTAPPDEIEITPPSELNLAEPSVEEVVPAPQGRGRLRDALGRDLDLGQLREELRPQGRRFIRRNGERGVGFGLEMAERGISFGLQFANGQTSRADLRAFGQDMRSRSRSFGIEMRDGVLEFGEELGGELGESSPASGSDPEFEETPGDITVDAPPVPFEANKPVIPSESEIFGRDVTDRDVKFRREF